MSFSVSRRPEGAHPASEMAAKKSIADQRLVRTFRIVRGGLEAVTKPRSHAKSWKKFTDARAPCTRSGSGPLVRLKLASSYPATDFKERGPFLPFEKVAQRDRDAVADQCP